jgi:hypothetical protein
MVEYISDVVFFYEKKLLMHDKVFDTLGRFRELQALYAASRTEPHLVTVPVMCCATTARLEAIDLERCRWEGVSRDESTAFGGLDALTAIAGHASSSPSAHSPFQQRCVSLARALGCRAEAPGWAGSHGRRHAKDKGLVSFTV